MAVLGGMASNGYPFTSRRKVVERIASEPAFAVEAVRFIDERNGWMASHRSRAAKLVARLAGGAPTAEDLAEAIVLMTPYARAISRILRERELAERPELAMQAAVFGILHPSPLVAPIEKGMQIEAVPAPTVDAPTATKKRGRPKGSKSRKPRSEPEQPKRRRPRS